MAISEKKSLSLTEIIVRQQKKERKILYKKTTLKRGKRQHHTRRFQTPHAYFANLTRQVCQLNTRSLQSPPVELANALQGNRPENTLRFAI